jgi:hypothetical protein
MGGASNDTGEIFKKVIFITANRPIKKDFSHNLFIFQSMNLQIWGV